MPRHACGYVLANAGHDTRTLQAWLGHRDIQHTVRYTELAPGQVQGLLAAVGCRETTVPQSPLTSWVDMHGASIRPDRPVKPV
jgi:type 1 fimbriae regulatory protein FimB/type 1 fimbriae regulatory protein FimE